MKLYQISESILCLLGEEDAELTPEAEASLSELQMAFEEKVEAVLQYRQGLLAEERAVRDEIDRLSKRGTALDEKADRLLDYLQREMKRLGKTKIRTQTFSASICKTGKPKAICDDESQEALDKLPAATADGKPDLELVKTEIKDKLDRQAVLQAFEAGYTLPVGISVVTGEHLRIT